MTSNVYHPQGVRCRGCVSHRFKQTDVRIEDFGDEFLVACPNCSRRARVVTRGANNRSSVVVSCVECGHSRDWKCEHPGVMYSSNLEHYKSGEVCIGAAVDWYFHLPLWLQIPCCGETLWAYNSNHLRFLESYVGALLRERLRDEDGGWSNRSLASRLPSWIKHAKNRAEILKCLEKLKRMLV